jgi:ABC-type phosphate/phosphonate transport system permease subunit
MRINRSESSDLSSSDSNQVIQNVENLFRPEVQALLTPDVQKTMQEAVAQGVSLVFWIALFASLICLLLAFILPKDTISKPN